ncbi:MAG: GNAT family N-acetyltransferase [Desulfobacteraceae bacterium]|nr:GNAT family N-acetyltransferase [Desulfobacteraceae bacterium]
MSDEIIRRFGTKGLYTSTLFHLRDGFTEEMSNAIELGRSFIRPEYQKKHNSLVLLWQGIGRFAAANPRYKILFGSVSISRDYRKISKNLMVEFLNQHKLNPELSELVSAKNPYRMWGNIGFDKEILCSPNSDIDDISVLISEIEKDGKKVSGAAQTLPQTERGTDRIQCG